MPRGPKAWQPRSLWAIVEGLVPGRASPLAAAARAHADQRRSRPLVGARRPGRRSPWHKLAPMAWWCVSSARSPSFSTSLPSGNAPRTCRTCCRGVVRPGAPTPLEFGAVVELVQAPSCTMVEARCAPCDGPVSQVVSRKPGSHHDIWRHCRTTSRIGIALDQMDDTWLPWDRTGQGAGQKTIRCAWISPTRATGLRHRRFAGSGFPADYLFNFRGSNTCMSLAMTPLSRYGGSPPPAPSAWKCCGTTDRRRCGSSWNLRVSSVDRAPALCVSHKDGRQPASSSSAT